MRLKLRDPNKELLLDLNFRTALLESVDWDESQFASLLSFLQESLLANRQLPSDLLENIKETYGYTAYIFIKNMFVDVYIENGLYSKNEDDYEH